ncbi:TPR repeat-containing protein [Alkalispirochaeta americana]|uniref:TPR repeat-containing protein n=1 Tax=Alkalispirochaeta americana TaxID=159291 RepID=A0A1N6P5T3_9SPIO|nr:tetratricopeptide repeat protein [Alkalispirochaeta americana]SIP99720.1 TPR repeat-containing protein [Alkalispirochaeta americana]
MRIPQSRVPAYRSRHGRRIFTVGIVALGAVVMGTGLTFLVVARSPVLPLTETDRALSAVEYWQAGDYEKVAALSTAQLQARPLDELPLSLRGFSRFYLALETVDNEKKQELLVAAVQDLRRALLTPSSTFEPQIRYILGKAYYHRGGYFYDAAIAELEQARARGIRKSDLLEYLALAHSELKHREQAIGYFQELLQESREPVHQVMLADLLVEEERHQEAEQLLLGLLSEDTDTVLRQHAYLTLGSSRKDQELYEKARETYQELLQLNPTSAEARYRLGEIHLAEGHRDRARYEWREALRLNPNHIESFQRLQEY